ncbi:cytidine deaminase [Faecalibacterium sp. DFI.5.82]|nr:cytidine deaminase [Faecalibacterium sp. DFI.5.82]MDE8689807.1 cytidine deaminase [Faecalibacterium sp. DFI.5.82]
MTAVIYARYSSDSQREASIEGQLRDCKDYAEKNGITVVGTYIDRAYSAKTDDRPDFQRMIKDSAKKIFDVVLVWKLDRFARNRFDAVNYKYQLEKNGVHLVSAMEPISQGPEGIMVESMLIGMAEYYSAELALKVARGERENALQCKYNGGVVPLGFTIGKEDRLYHIDPETAPIVQEIFTRYADGEPAEKIAASLNERGLRTRTGKPFVKNSFFQIFRNRRYIGEYRYKDIVTPGGIPAIVDQDLFDRVQQRFEQNRIAHGRPAKEDVRYLLTTKLFCGKCGTLMGGESGTSHMGNTYYYYKCGNAKRHGKAHCDLKAIRKEPLERFVVDTAIKVIFSDEIIERLIDLVMEAQQKENTRLPVLKDQLRDTEKRLANLLEAIEQGILTPTTKQRLDELEARKEALNTSILEEELKKPVLTREWIRFWLEKFRKGDVGSTEHQRQIIDTFVNSVYVFDDRVVLNFNFTDDAKTVTREEVLGSSAVENAPPYSLYLNPILYEKGFGYFFISQDVLYAESMQDGKQERTKAGYRHDGGTLPFAILHRVWYTQLNNSEVGMEIYMRNYEIENEMYRRAVELIETRYPVGWGGAGVVHTSNGNYYTSVSIETANASAVLCIETGAMLEAHKFNEKVTHCMCLVRKDEKSPYQILSPCGICQERLRYWGEDVQVAVTAEEEKIKFVQLKELQPYHWTKAYPAEELEHWNE